MLALDDTRDVTARPAWRARALDGLLALGAFGATLVLLGPGGSPESDPRTLDPLGALLAAAATLPLLAWRRAPRAVFVATALASSALAGLGYPLGPPVGATVALFLLALLGELSPSRGWRLPALVAALFALHVAAAGLARDEFPTAPLLFGLAVWPGAWLAGDRVRYRRLRIEELEERARRAEREAERDRRLAAAEERMRIARDLHDSAGHAINVILVQAGAARLLRERDPQGAQRALETIEEVARETIAEIDALVRVLREDEQPGREVEPPAGLAALPTLLARGRAAGLDVELAVDGAMRALPPAVDQAAYRILQEALTNAARHGRGTATVRVHRGTDALELAVENAVDGLAPAGSGHGLAGMRERAALLGGRLEAGAAGGRFRVRAALPVPPDAGGRA